MKLHAERRPALTGLSPEVVRLTIFESGLELRYEAGELTTEEFHAEFETRTGAKVAIDLLSHACSDMFALKPGMAPLLAELRSAGHRVGLLSNTNIAIGGSSTRTVMKSCGRTLSCLRSVSN
jgi:FMN phosphatase YigB (HAD superfamily)